MNTAKLLLALALTALAFLAASLNTSSGQINPPVPAPVTIPELYQYYTK